MADLLGRYLPRLDADERGRLITLAEGSPGRAIMLAEDEGLKIALLVDKLLADLPAVPASRGYEIADFLGRSETGFSTLMDLLRAGVSAAVRESVRGQSGSRTGAAGRAAPAGCVGRGLAGPDQAAGRDRTVQSRQASGDRRRDWAA